MRRREYYWSLFHTTEQNQLSDLRTDQVEAIYSAIPRKQRREWLVWRESFQGWKPFEDFPELLRALRNVRDPIAAPKPPSIASRGTGTGSSSRTGTGIGSGSGSSSGTKSRVRKGSVIDIPTTVTTMAAIEGEIEGLTIGGTSVDSRTSMRFNKKFEVKIMDGKRVFKTATVNISLKGMQVKDPLPRDLPQIFNVEIKTIQGIVPVVCSEVKTKDGSRSTRLRIEVNDFVHLLQSALFTNS
jgi:hypothetical protein